MSKTKKTKKTETNTKNDLVETYKTIAKLLTKPQTSGSIAKALGFKGASGVSRAKRNVLAMIRQGMVRVQISDGKSNGKVGRPATVYQLA